MGKATQTCQSKKSYTELSKLSSFDERLRYLCMGGTVGKDTFGFDRYINQALYKSKEWREVRNRVIIRDKGYDLGIADEWSEELARPIIHHINPITEEDIENRNPCVFDMDNLILCSHKTHNKIHYGDSSEEVRPKIVERRPNDTSPWRT